MEKHVITIRPNWVPIPVLVLWIKATVTPNGWKKQEVFREIFRELYRVGVRVMGSGSGAGNLGLAPLSDATLVVPEMLSLDLVGDNTRNHFSNYGTPKI